MGCRLVEVVKERLDRDRENLITECLVYGAVAIGLAVWIWRSV